MRWASARGRGTCRRIHAESNQGFLLNHVISELLPERNGYRYSNSDPVTGQAAWYDLRVRVEKVDAVEAGRPSRASRCSRARPASRRRRTSCATAPISRPTTK